MGREVMYPERPIVGVGAVLPRNGKILLVKRKNDPGKGKWSIPGGVVNLGERLDHAVIREVQEETGLETEHPELVDVVDVIKQTDHGQVKYHFVIVDFILRSRQGNPRAGDDAEEILWVNLDEALQYDLTDSFRKFLHKNRGMLERRLASSDVNC